MIVTPANLDDVMQFDHVVLVSEDGTVTEPTGVYAPTTVEMSGSLDVYVDSDWELLTGWSGQYSYSGPVMHESEFIGGRLAEHILSTPGYWVTVVVYDLGDNTDSNIVGWAVAYKGI